jgi:pilus assembly protein CpaF
MVPQLEIRAPDGSVRREVLSGDLLVGRAAHCDVRLSGWRVAAEHARLLATPAGVLVEDLGAFTGLEVDGRRVEGGCGPLRGGQEIAIAGWRLRVVDAEPAAEPAAIASDAGRTAWAPSDGPRSAGIAVQTAAARRDGPARPPVPVRPQPAAAEPPAPLLVAWRRRVHARLIEALDLRREDVSGLSDAGLRARTTALVDEIVAGLGGELPPEVDPARLRREVIDEAVGLGPLEALLADETVTEIMVNRHDRIWVERGGRLEPHATPFTDDRAVMAVIERIVAPLGRRIDEASPTVDARLRDGSRVHAIVPPLAVHGPCLTIRRFPRRRLTAADLVTLGSMSPAMAGFLEVCVRERRNLVVSGGTGSGKTTLLNVLSGFVPRGERVITVEDAAELQLDHPHLVSLEARPPNAEGQGAVTIRELVRNTLRMRPDRIVVGECRGAEALDMLQAMNTGHDGSLTTLHANAPRDALARLETMVLMAGMDLPLAAVREQIASAVDLIVQVARFPCGTRRVTTIAEVTGLESGTVQMQELFRFEPADADGRHGRFTGCDAVPEFYEALRRAGRVPDLDLFRAPA